MIAQIAIAIFGVAAVWLSQSPRLHEQRWAGVFGLISQPFWFYATWTAGQWGMFALCFVFTWAWARGVHTYWGATIRAALKRGQ